jgi:hypothetical protein
LDLTILLTTSKRKKKQLKKISNFYLFFCGKLAELPVEELWRRKRFGGSEDLW